MSKIVSTRAAKTAPKRLSLERLKEPSTWGGMLTVAAAIATGGASVLTDPIMLGQLAAGIGLIFTVEG